MYPWSLDAEIKTNLQNGIYIENKYTLYMFQKYLNSLAFNFWFLFFLFVLRYLYL